MKYKLNECIGARFRRITRTIDNVYRVNLSDTPVTEQQMTILFYLKMRGSCEQGLIGRDLVLERSTVSRNVKALVVMGFIIKSDDYRPTLNLSANGVQMVEKLIPIWEKIMDQLIMEIGDENLALIQGIESKLV